MIPPFLLKAGESYSKATISDNTSRARYSSYGAKIKQTGDSGSYTYSVASDWANRPVNYVSWFDAARFTNWLTTGNTENGVYTFAGTTVVSSIMDRQAALAAFGVAYFLPTEDEWYKAAYYDPSKDGAVGYWDYPTGSDDVPSNQLAPDLRKNATFFQSDYTIGSPYYRTEVGAHANSASPYGTFDQAGNVWEWNETLIGSSRGLRGGSFYSDSNVLAASHHNSLNPTLEYTDVGFRVARITPEPGGLVGLAGMALMGLIWWWRRK